MLKNIDNMILYKVLKEVVYYLYGDLDILNIFFFLKRDEGRWEEKKKEL